MQKIRGNRVVDVWGRTGTRLGSDEEEIRGIL